MKKINFAVKKINFAVLSFLVMLSFITTAHAYDLPIDIDAIGRQTPTGRFTQRIGENLFTEDSQRINDALAERIQQRQDIAFTLFETVSFNEDVNPRDTVMAAASDLNLFSQTTTFTTFNTVQEDTEMPTWAIVAIIAVCAIVGFALALRSIAKKRKQAEDVY